ncbi:hypothetical protein TESG_08244 [Trichophyton tonsurans CBS 112818]|uniref:Uncharacterized protein n=1 Tax=Trichophyton tonsurans (strain CBS 112818) TaxID=647933 RepID=F2RN76_TRIT1|nr:hypothetical protein TESG_08244 [Trichophyton tonsurans CBS 112818]
MAQRGRTKGGEPGPSTSIVIQEGPGADLSQSIRAATWRCLDGDTTGQRESRKILWRLCRSQPRRPNWVIVVFRDATRRELAMAMAMAMAMKRMMMMKKMKMKKKKKNTVDGGYNTQGNDAITEATALNHSIQSPGLRRQVWADSSLFKPPLML